MNLTSRIKGRNLFQKDDKYSSYSYCSGFSDFKGNVLEGKGVGFCNNICSVIVATSYLFWPDKWRSLIDSSNISLKAVFLHIVYKFPSIPVAHAADM